MNDPSKPMFWRDERMPYVELRKVIDGRKLCYAPHSHRHWSLGAITEGQSTFLYRGEQFRVSAGSLVIMDPNSVHACNPIDNQPWSYLMLYIDTDWLTHLRYQAGCLEVPCWQDFSTAIIQGYQWYAGYCRVAECLLAPDRALLEKQTLLVEYLTALMHELSGQAAEAQPPVPDNLQAVADYLHTHATEEVSLDALCACSGYSPSHLVRSFKQHFGLTPHAYLINYRIQYGQRELKEGKPIAQTAVNAGFADQPHFQRAFKKLLAATPGQYRQSSLNQQIDTADGQ